MIPIFTGYLTPNAFENSYKITKHGFMKFAVIVHVHSSMHCTTFKVNSDLKRLKGVQMIAIQGDNFHSKQQNNPPIPFKLPPLKKLYKIIRTKISENSRPFHKHFNTHRRSVPTPPVLFRGNQMA